VTDDRLGHLMQVAPLLWPAPSTAAVGAAGGAPSARLDEFLLLPSARRPRLLVPTGRRASAAVVRHSGEGRGRRDRAVAAALALALRAGLGAVLRTRLQVRTPGPASAASLADHLSSVLGRDVVTGMHLGPPRANRKPVLQVLTPAGGTLAYAKLGVDPLTDSLVRAEATALASLAAAPMHVVAVPELLHAGPWAGHDLLVQSALPVWSRRRPLTSDRLVAAASEIAGLGRVDGVAFATSAFRTDLAGRVAALPPGEAGDRLSGLLRRLDAVAGSVPLSLGGSHGDWAPWNMACLADRLLVWDWERFRPLVPVGFDLLHHRLQHDLVVRAQDPLGAACRLVDDAEGTLGPLGSTARSAQVTTALYLADLAARYLADNQLEAGARLGDATTYLLPALDRGIGRLEGEDR
jgi:hypothetical protein